MRRRHFILGLPLALQSLCHVEAGALGAAWTIVPTIQIVVAPDLA